MRRFLVVLLSIIVVASSSLEAQMRHDVDLSGLEVRFEDSMVPVFRGPLSRERLVIVLLSTGGGKRRAVRSPAPIESAPFVIAVAVTPAIGGGMRITLHWGDVLVGTYVQARIWSLSSTVPVVDKDTIINVLSPNPDWLWWALLHEGPIPTDWTHAELLVTEPDKPTKRAFVTFSAGGGSGPARVATLDAGGGIHLDGFYLHRPVVVVPVPVGVALKSDSSDFNYFPPTEGVVAGTVLTVCDKIEAVGFAALDNRQCVTGTIEAAE